MSRLASSRMAPSASGPGQDGELPLDQKLSGLRLHNGKTDPSTLEICPVCKSSRYLNKDMKFLVNPECYHRMCLACADRLFAHGPAKCPIAGCHRTLRRNRFRVQTFEDMVVEREVDIRKRVASVFNRREDEFDSLDDYNNYLNDVEDMTYNLVNKIDVEATERKMAAYAEQNSIAITSNAAIVAQETQDISALQQAEREQARLRRAAARREEEEERRAKAESQRDIINRIATGTGDPQKIAEEGQRVTLKKRLDKRTAATKLAPTAANGGFMIKGLKARQEVGPEAPFDAFGGLRSKSTYHVLQDDYEWNWLDNLKTDVAYRAGGYKPSEFYSRALCEAFSGLGVIIGHEDNGVGAVKSTVSAVHAGTGAKEVKLEDPF